VRAEKNIFSSAPDYLNQIFGAKILATVRQMTFRLGARQLVRVLLELCHGQGALKLPEVLLEHSVLFKFPIPTTINKPKTWSKCH